MTYVAKVHSNGPDILVVEDGGAIIANSGATIHANSGATIQLASGAVLSLSGIENVRDFIEELIAALDAEEIGSLPSLTSYGPEYD